jgi:SagB-type dehydrogenase family enzyme
LQVSHYRQILTRLRSGDTDRAIARSGLMDRRKVAALRRVAAHTGWLDPRNPLPEDAVIAAGLVSLDGKSSAESGADAAALRARRGSNEQIAHERYLAKAKRGQQLLATGQLVDAVEVFAELLVWLGAEPSFARAVVLGRLARCFYMSGRSELAVARLQEALEVTARLAPSEGLRALRGTLHSELGDVLRVMGQPDGARQAFVAALRIAEELQDRRAQGVDLNQLGSLALAEGKQEEAVGHYQEALALFHQMHEPAMEAATRNQLGAVFHHQRQWPEAEEQYREAARLTEQHGNLAAAAQSWNQLAVLNQQAGKPEAAEAWYRKAIEADRSSGNQLQFGNHLGNLADLLMNQPGRLGESRQFAEAALDINKTVDPASAEVWRNYGILAEVSAKEAAATADSQRRSELQTQARDYRQLQQYAPRFFAALTRLGAEPSFARAVILGRLARCFYMSGRSELAVARLQEALEVTARLAPSKGLKALRGTLHSELGDVLRVMGEAVGHFQEALALFHQMHEPAMEAATRKDPSTPFSLEPENNPDLPFHITLDEELITDYALDGDLLVDGPRERRIIRWTGEPHSLAGDLRLMLIPGVRTGMDDQGAIRFYLPLAEPVFERELGCTLMWRLRREVTVSGNSAILWRLIRVLDGTRCIAEVLSELPVGDRTIAARMLGALAATGAIDISGRPIARFLHSVTKKGVMPAGGLEGDDVLQLAMDGNYGTYPGASRIPLSQSVPERLRPFYALTRSRRSRRDYRGLSLSRNDFDALLSTACGVTGAMPWAGREAKLRAYPASGALYAVEIYPVVLRVDDLAPGVYHYCAADNSLEVVRNHIDQALLVNAALPMERDMVAGAASMICLTGRFQRHERKYGEGGYRMLVAETGHISQNLILTATALGLSARPFGGVFDDLLNSDLGLDEDAEQFLLSVLVGHAGDGDHR